MLPFQTPGVVAVVDVGGVLGVPVGGLVGLAPEPVVESPPPLPPQAVNARLAAMSVIGASREPFERFMNVSRESLKPCLGGVQAPRKRRPPAGGLRRDRLLRGVLRHAAMFRSKRPIVRRSVRVALNETLAVPHHRIRPGLLWAAG